MNEMDQMCGYDTLHGQHLSVSREHGNAKHCFVIAVREHSDTRADEDVDDRPIARHLP